MEADETLFQAEGDRREALAASITGEPKLDGYSFDELLGEGSFGQVWSGVQERTGQKVAIKLLKTRSGLDISYFQAEMAKLRMVSIHPGIVSLLDADLGATTPYFVMPLLQSSLDRRCLATPKPSVAEVVDWFRETAEALVFSHERGLLHCDIKPANLMLDDQSRVRLVDFGQGLFAGSDQVNLGTLGYMPPEQLADHSTPGTSWDIHALGATFYFLLSGVLPRLPSDTATLYSKCESVSDRLDICRDLMMQNPITPLSDINPEVDEDLNNIILACLRRDPALRTSSVRQIVTDLKRREEKLPLESSRPWKRSYRFKRWFSRNRSVLLRGFLLWSTLLYAYGWLETDKPIEIDLEHNYPSILRNPVPVSENAWPLYLRATQSNYLKKLPTVDLKFDLNKDGVVDNDDLELTGAIVANPRYFELARGPGLDWYFELEAKTLESVWEGALRPHVHIQKEADFQALGSIQNVARLALLKARSEEQNGKLDEAWQAGIAVLLMTSRCSAESGLSGQAEGWGTMSATMKTLDFLDSLNIDEVSKSKLDETAELLAVSRPPETFELWIARRDYLTNRTLEMPAINLAQPVPLSVFRGQIVGLYREHWNALTTQLKSGQVPIRQEVSPSLFSWFHPVKWGASYLTSQARYSDQFLGNYWMFQTRLRGLEVRVAQARFRKESGRNADTLEQLVPRFLDNIPSDPRSPNLPLFFESGRLYSLGPREEQPKSSWDSYSEIQNWSPGGLPYIVWEIPDE